MDGEEKKSTKWLWITLGCMGCFGALVALLLIGGVVATFTIPKLLDSSEQAQNTAIFKEVAGMVSGGYQAYTEQNKTSADTRADAMQQYLNYVREESENNYAGSFNCTDPSIRCLLLHNGGVLAFKPDQTFGSVDTTRYLVFNIDPDADGPATAASLLLFDTGRLTTGANGAQGIPGPGGIDVITTEPDYVQAMYED